MVKKIINKQPFKKNRLSLGIDGVNFRDFILYDLLFFQVKQQHQNTFFCSFLI